MTPTVYDATAVVNPVHAHLGHEVRDLYDWLRSRTRPGRTRRVEELTPPGPPRYEQLADVLRRRIFDGTWPDDASGPTFGREYKVSPPVVQRAFEVLEREGLVRMEAGKRTTVAPRQRWRIDFRAAAPGLDWEAHSRIGAALEAAAAAQPAVSNPGTIASGAAAVHLTMTVESASLGGAVTAALAVAQQALGPLPIVAMSAEEAQP